MLSSSNAPCGYKRWARRPARSTSNLKLWLAFGVLALENLRVACEVSATKPSNPNALIGSMLEIMSLHIPMRQGFRGWVACSCVIFLGLPGSGCSRTAISGEETYPHHNVFSEKEKFLCKMLQEILQGDYCNMPPYSWNFSPRIWVSLFPWWE
jgi:hypothetical protein